MHTCRPRFPSAWIGCTASQNAHDDPTFLSSLGVLLNDNGTGQPLYTTFSGVTGLTADDVLIRYTQYGRTSDLSGVIDAADYGRMGTSLFWSGGDFNYDGLVNAVDYALIDFQSMKQGAGFFDAMHTLHTDEYGKPNTDVFGALQAGTYFTQGVPEPTGALDAWWPAPSNSLADEAVRGDSAGQALCADRSKV